MKLTVCLAIMFIGCVLTTSGQAPKGDYYWVVETNTNVANHSIVKIYDQQNALIHEVELQKRLDITNRKHRKALVQIVKNYSTREASGGKKLKSQNLASANSQ
jgi:hypothetical protein